MLSAGFLLRSGEDTIISAFASVELVLGQVRSSDCVA